jgi:hypothetical protein
MLYPRLDEIIYPKLKIDQEMVTINDEHNVYVPKRIQQ